MIRKLALAIYVKYPEPGRVKTRLAADLGPERAARAYEIMVDRLLTRSLKPLPAQCDPVLYCDPFVPLERYEARFSRFGFPFAMQRGADLGAKLAATFEDLLGRYESAAIVGSDCVALGSRHVDQSRRRLAEGADVVLGPAEDGGYYLVALKRPLPALFAGVAWSTAHVLEQTLERARAAGVQVALLEKLADIDTVEDWEKSGLGSPH